MDKTKLKKLFHELKATTSDVIFTLFMFSMLYLLIHALITDYREGDRIKRQQYHRNIKRSRVSHL